MNHVLRSALELNILEYFIIDPYEVQKLLISICVHYKFR
jgi:hypothetical protein